MFSDPTNPTIQISIYLLLHTIWNFSLTIIWDTLVNKIIKTFMTLNQHKKKRFFLENCVFRNDDTKSRPKAITDTRNWPLFLSSMNHIMHAINPRNKSYVYFCQDRFLLFCHKCFVGRVFPNVLLCIVIIYIFFPIQIYLCLIVPVKKMKGYILNT